MSSFFYNSKPNIAAVSNFDILETVHDFGLVQAYPNFKVSLIPIVGSQGLPCVYSTMDNKLTKRLRVLRVKDTFNTSDYCSFWSKSLSKRKIIKKIYELNMDKKKYLAWLLRLLKTVQKDFQRKIIEDFASIKSRNIKLPLLLFIKYKEFMSSIN